MTYGKDDIRNKLVDFFENKFEISFKSGETDADTDLFDEGLIDSMDSLILVTFLEKTFDITINPQHLTDNPFNSVNDIADLVFQLAEKGI